MKILSDATKQALKSSGIKDNALELLEKDLNKSETITGDYVRPRELDSLATKEDIGNIRTEIANLKTDVYKVVIISTSILGLLMTLFKFLHT